MKELLTEQELVSISDKITKDGLTWPYIKKYFNSYVQGKKLDQTVLKYEMEYLLGGQETDRANLQYIVNRLILLRFSLNCVYALKDQELNVQALSLATSLVGFTGIVPVIEGVKYTILGAVSFGEALLDVKNLLSGQKIPILKNKTNWNLSVQGLAQIQNKKGNSSKTGIGYEDYLMILLLLQTKSNRTYLRMLDLMQVNIQKEQPDFLIQQCRFGVRIESQFAVKTWFAHGTYQLLQNRAFSY